MFEDVLTSGKLFDEIQRRVTTGNLLPYGVKGPDQDDDDEE